MSREFTPTILCFISFQRNYVEVAAGSILAGKFGLITTQLKKSTFAWSSLFSLFFFSLCALFLLFRERKLQGRGLRKITAVGMAGAKLIIIALVVVSVAAVGAEVHHVVGGDRGWDPSSDIGSWSSGRIFRVGDKIWFTYSAAQDKIVEVKSKEEYEACDLRNPIKMYTDGLDSVSLDVEGIRYFASGKAESCKNGLKLHVEVKPHAIHVNHTTLAKSEGSASASTMATADGPTTPSASTRLNGLSRGMFVGLLLCYLGLY